MDLLTTVTHELGNALGFKEVRTPGNVMAETLALGVRGLDFDSLTAREPEGGPQNGAGSTNALAPALGSPRISTPGASRYNSAGSMVDWDGEMVGLLSGLHPFVDARVTTGLKPLFPAFDYGSEGSWARRVEWTPRDSKERVETKAPDTTLVPSVGWSWQVEVAEVS